MEKVGGRSLGTQSEMKSIYVQPYVRTEDCRANFL